MKTPLILLSLLALATPQDPEKLYLKKSNGDIVAGTLVSLQGDQVRMQVQVLGGVHTATYRLEDFDPASAFRLDLAANPPKDFASHFAMAKKAANMGLLPQAGNEARAALRSSRGSPDHDAKVKEVRGWAADALEATINKALADKDAKQAQHCLKLLSTRLPDTRTMAQMHAIADKVDALVYESKKPEREARQRRIDQETREKMDRLLEPIQREIDHGDARYREAVRKSRSTATSSNLCGEAVRYYKKAWESLQKLLARHPDDKHLATVGGDMTHHIHDNAIRAALHAANMLTVQSDYKGAMDWAQKVLKFDPNNAEAKAMVHTIEMTEADASGDWGWGWRTVSNRVPGRRLYQ